MKQTYLEKTATVHSNWLLVEECIFCLGSRGCRLVAFRDIRDDEKREVEPNRPTGSATHESASNRSTKAIALSTWFLTSNYRIPHQSQLPRCRSCFRRSYELNLGSLRSFLRSLSPRFKLIVYNIQHESRRPSRIVRHDSSRYQIPNFASFLHFEPPQFKMEGRYSNLDLKYEFSASNSTRKLQNRI